MTDHDARDGVALDVDVDADVGGVLWPAGLPTPAWAEAAFCEDAAAVGIDVAPTSTPMRTWAELYARVPAACASEAAALFAAVRLVELSQHANRRQVLGGKVLQSSVPASLRDGRRITLAARHLPAGVVVGADRAGLGVDDDAFVHDVAAAFVDEDGVVCALHPLAAEPHEPPHLVGRALSSERTVAVARGGAFFLVKTSLPRVVGAADRVIDPAEAREAVLLSADLEGALRRASGVCVLRECLAVVDDEHACVVRDPRPWPSSSSSSSSPPSSSSLSWAMPLHALFDRWEATGVPLLHALVAPTAAAVVSRVVEPCVETALTLLLDLGLIGNAHAQNLWLELNEHGALTGRAALSDFEDLWPHPRLTPALGALTLRPAVFALIAERGDFDPCDDLQDFLLFGALDPLLVAAERWLPLDEVKRLRPLVHETLARHVQRRAAVVRAHADGPLRFLAEHYLAP